MAIETKLAIFKDKHSLSDDAINELKTIFDSVIVEFAHKIMNSELVNKTIPKLDTSPVMFTEKKFATKIADEYASECNVTLEEIPSLTGKVTKKDIEKYVKSKIGSKSKVSAKTDFETEAESDSETKKIVSKKTVSKKEKNPSKTATSVSVSASASGTKEKCGGITKDGNPCNLNATKTPDGSKKCYCFRHAIDWKQYEVSSDSDYEDDNPDKKIREDVAEVTSD